MALDQLRKGIAKFCGKIYNRHMKQNGDKKQKYFDFCQRFCTFNQAGYKIKEKISGG
jgi:hypothetical protein